MLILADELEPTFNPEGCNYYMALPEGEILLLLMREKQILSLFVPYQVRDNAAEPKPEAPPEPKPEPQAGPAVRFCKECGAALRPGAKFCAKCGSKI